MFPQSPPFPRLSARSFVDLRCCLIAGGCLERQLLSWISGGMSGGDAAESGVCVGGCLGEDVRGCQGRGLNPAAPGYRYTRGASPSRAAREKRAV